MIRPSRLIVYNFGAILGTAPLNMDNEVIEGNMPQ